MTRRPWAVGAAVLGLSLSCGALLATGLVPHQPSACTALQASERPRCTDVGANGLAVVRFPRSGPCATCWTAEYLAAHPWDAYTAH